jgi:hypothetical protein
MGGALPLNLPALPFLGWAASFSSAWKNTDTTESNV